MEDMRRVNKENYTGKYCDDVAVLGPIIALHNQLVSPGNEGKAVIMVKGFGDVLAKGVASAAGGDAPAAAVVGIGPKKVAHGTLMWHFLDAVKGFDVVERVNAG